MQDIEVTIQPFTERGRLLYYPDPEASDRLFSLKSPLYQRQVYQVATNEPILFSLDADRLLVAIEFIIPQSVWQVVPTLRRPSARDYTSLAFSERTVRHESFDLYAAVTTDTSYMSVLVQFGTLEKSSYWVSLSEECLALMSENRLKGFYIQRTS